VASGKSNAVIDSGLDISVETVRTKQSTPRKKSEVSDRIQLEVMALLCSLIDSLR